MSTTTCQYCGKEFYYEYRNPWSRPRVCSSDCRRDSKILRLENKFQPEESDLIVTRSKYVVFKRDGFKCFYCGVSSIKDGVKLEVDHLVPITSHGVSTISNLVTACESCNCSKSGTVFTKEELHDLQEEVNRRNVSSGLKEDLLVKVCERTA
jgi:5-methylcytosine-specific restriction endonuclease McrA